MEEEMERGQEQDEQKEKKKPPALSPRWNCGSPLYDAFELASVHCVLDRHLMALPFARRRSPSPARDAGRARRATSAKGHGGRRRTAAKASRRTGKAVLHTILRSVTCSRKL